MFERRAGFFFVRHGETTANAAGVRSGGDSDPPLTDTGRAQAAEARAALVDAGAALGLIYCAPLDRTMETARIIGHEAELRSEPALAERRLGGWNGRSVAETQPLIVAGETPPGGEDDASFRARALGGFEGIGPEMAHWPLIVSSRGVSRILLEHAGFPRGRALPNGAVIAVVAKGPPFTVQSITNVLGAESALVAD